MNGRMNTSKAVGFMFAAMLVMGAFVGVAGSAAATDIANITEEVTTLFIDLIPLIIILGVFGMIMGVIRFRK
jgi:amino acid transporter